MNVYAKGERWSLFHGDCRDVLASLPDCSIDSVVTDPPYGLSKEPDAAEVLRHWLAGDDYEHKGGGFMGKSWDSFVPGPSVWREVYRVLKPGGHICVFGGTRTYDLMVMAIRLAGFEVRDQIMAWTFASGFPKSLDVSKAIDKQRHDRADILRVTNWIADAVKTSGVKHSAILEAFGFNAGSGMVGHWTARVWGSQPAVPTLEQVPLLLDTLGVDMDDVPEDIRRLLWDLNGRKGQPGENWWKREVVSSVTKGSSPLPNNHDGRWDDGQKDGTFNITAPATDAAKQWEGWGTALKPAHEPIVLARKPLIGTVAANVLEHGTGALNIDGCRVGNDSTERTRTDNDFGLVNDDGWTPTPGTNGSKSGRWPANVIFDTEAGRLLDEQSGESRSPTKVTRGESGGGSRTMSGGVKGRQEDVPCYGDTGGASRFFTSIEWEPEIDVPFRYVPKPSKRERNAGLDGLPEKPRNVGDERPSGSFAERRGYSAPPPQANHHVTVKPLALMRWLVRLVTPPGGTVLEPFAGSGTTMMAALMEGFTTVGVEMTDEYLPIIEGRIAWAENHEPEPQAEQLGLLD